LSTGFNKGLDADGDQSIGIGVQATLARNNIDFSRVTFANQYTGGGFDLNVPSGETINSQSISYVDLNAGLLYNYKDENNNQFSLGASMYHILGPRLSFFSGNNGSLQRRYTVHLGANLNAGANDQFFFSGHIMQQAGASEMVIGGAYGFDLGEADANLYLGAWLRVKDAFYPYIGLRSANWQAGFSYDITQSDLKQVKRFNSSSELSVMYFFNGGAGRKGIPCFF
jgi:type IX secretion system PorP/SprF family membrane protein